jgi:anti-sigma B factor antagonist
MAEGASRLQIAEHQVDDVTVLVLSGEMLVDDGDLAFGRKIVELIARGQVKLIIDLAAVSHIDSSGVGMMVAKAKAVRAAHGDMKLVRLTSRTQRLLSMMKLVLVFETFDDEASAIRSYSWKPNQ